MADINNQRQVDFQEAIKRGFEKYAIFSGRASLSEFWWWILFTFIVGAVCGVINQYLASLANLALLIPTLAISWRRLHDIGRAGGWWFINFIPLVGWIIFIIWCVKPSEPQENRFGDIPNA